jgi:HEAT repeat protein
VAFPHRPPVLNDVVEEHLEEFSFLSIQRRKMLFSPDVGLRGVLGIDARLDAHHDAVRIAGSAGIDVAVERLDEIEPWHRYAAARVWVENGVPGPEQVVERVEGADDDAIPAWREALRRSSPDVARRLSATRAHAASRRVLAVVTDACGWHGMPLPESPTALMESDDSSVRTAVARALRRDDVADTSDEALIDVLSHDAEPAVARAALWSLALRDPARARRRCRERLDRGDGEPFVIQTLGLLGERADVERLLPWVADPATRESSIRALGHIGAIEVVDLLLRMIASTDRDAAMAAGDALETIVGLLAPPPRRRAPRESDAGPLPPPAAWAEAEWRRLAPTFDAGRRWHRGHPFPDSGSGDPPMEWMWRHAVLNPGAGSAWLRREIPDGFFEAAPALDARPGE